jgi:signal transduction histidine kinase
MAGRIPQSQKERRSLLGTSLDFAGHRSERGDYEFRRRQRGYHRTQTGRETLRRYAAELETRNQELDAFAHTVAHDLKNPIGLIVGYAELSLDTPRPRPRRSEKLSESLPKADAN